MIFSDERPTCKRRSLAIWNLNFPISSVAVVVPRPLRRLDAYRAIARLVATGPLCRFTAIIALVGSILAPCTPVLAQATGGAGGFGVFESGGNGGNANQGGGATAFTGTPGGAAGTPPSGAGGNGNSQARGCRDDVLTDRARQIIREAAANSTQVQYTRIEVNGHTDTSGTPRYNQGLSVRRANAVAVELVRNGVPRNVIAIRGFGQTLLLVPTGPGMREPQNRRVEIIVQ